MYTYDLQKSPKYLSYHLTPDLNVLFFCYASYRLTSIH